MDSLKLRPYQERAINDARRVLARGKRRVLLVCPTGGGKTVIAASIMAGAVAKTKRALFLAHRRELIDQCYGKLLAFGVPESALGTILAGDLRARPNANVQVASVQTLVGRARPPADLVFIDEAHHITAASYGKILADYPDARIVGLTATPCREDGRGLGDVFDEMVHVATFDELAAESFLVAPRVFTSPKEIDLTGIKTTAGDYNRAQLEARMNQREIVGDVLTHWQQHAEGRTTVVFACGVDHSRQLRDAFIAAGITAEHIDGTTPVHERDATLRRLASGATTVVCNMGVLTEGWDLPRCKCVVIARPTKSRSLYLQMAGRGLRPWEGVSAVLLDHGRCAVKHGLPQEAQEWTLDGKQKRNGSVPVKTCGVCFAAVPSATLVCPECGFEFGSGGTAIGSVKEVDGVLVEVKINEAEKQERRAWYTERVQIAARRNYKIGWARHLFREKFGEWPLFYSVERQFLPSGADASAA